MKKINVIDLDRTLIPYDSFGELVKNELKQINLFVWLVSFFRVFRLISRDRFKQIITIHLKKKHSNSFFNNYAKTIYNDIDTTVIDLVYSKTDNNTINILLSASPQLYVQGVVKLLNWVGSGSYFDENRFINLYSREKINWLKNNYPAKDYKYCFSISDSHSDDELLNLFENSVLWKK